MKLWGTSCATRSGTRSAHASMRRSAATVGPSRGYLATDDSDIDAERFIARTVDKLENPHITAIEVIAEWEATATANAETDSVDHLLTKEFGTELGRLVTRQLANEGILGGETDVFGGNTVIFGLSDYGHRVHEHLIAHADD